MRMEAQAIKVQKGYLSQMGQAPGEGDGLPENHRTKEHMDILVFV